MIRTAERLEGQLTATLHLKASDTPTWHISCCLLSIGRAGRILANGWPTGVEMSYSMAHGGPYPATSDSRSTSVGTLAIRRFLRPVCYQDLPAELLPEALCPDHSLDLPRLLNGRRSG
jgi:NADP-dependent aldehyde dehydrogenase